MQDVNVRDGVGGSWVLDDQVVDFDKLTLLETDAEIGLGQCANVVADVGVLRRHVDDHVAEGPLLDVFVFFGFQHAHEAEVLGRNLGVEVALEDGVRHLVAKDDESAAACAEQGLRAAFNIFDNALVTFVDDDEH